MNILHLTPHFYLPESVVNKWKVDLDQIGGMQTQIYRLCMLLSDFTNQTILTITAKETAPIIELHNKITVIRTNVPMLPIKSKINCTVGLNFYWLFGTLSWLIKYKLSKHRTKFHIAHVHCSGVVATLISGIIAKILVGCKLIYTVHCCRGATYHPMGVFDKFFNKIAVYLELKCLKKADNIIVLTKRTREYMLTNYI